MNKPTITSKSPTEFHISGILDFDNVSSVLQEASEIITRSTAEVKFDFAGISQSNSAGLALLTALLRHAHETHKNILFLNLPAKLLAAAKISDLDSILPCTPTTSEA
ncbi:MAG TPA: STAS domain-containing protein [Gammaproteobacteria bacterium]|nr:STAS domain-containing protein [Gammaproteobacteria bacterium]